MLESGFASAQDIDAGMVQGCAHPQGPLALADLIGLDTTAAVAQSMYEEIKEPLYPPPPLLLRMVDAGLLGRKTGRGLFPYARWHQRGCHGRTCVGAGRGGRGSGHDQSSGWATITSAAASTVLTGPHSTSPPGLSQPAAADAG